MRNSKGFTLIELLIVVVIIGILAAIAIPKFGATKDKAYLATMKSDLRNLVTAEESYFADYVTYTNTFPTTQWAMSTGVSLTAGITATGTGWSAKVQHQALTGKFCDIFGAAGPTGGLAVNEGEAKCTP
jgi:prepilin-type N-terminal cleavage/methylation domain-containing protein